MIVARLVPATTFFVGVSRHFMPSGFLKLGIADATIGLIILAFLRKI
jgi:hypothetical protein